MSKITLKDAILNGKSFIWNGKKYNGAELGEPIHLDNELEIDIIEVLKNLTALVEVEEG